MTLLSVRFNEIVFRFLAWCCLVLLLKLLIVCMCSSFHARRAAAISGTA